MKTQCENCIYRDKDKRGYHTGSNKPINFCQLGVKLKKGKTCNLKCEQEWHERRIKW